MDKWKLSETEDEPADDGPFPYVWPQSEEEAYNKYVGKSFKGPPITRPIIPNTSLQRGSNEVNKSIWSRVFVLVKSYAKAVKERMYLFWRFICN